MSAETPDGDAAGAPRAPHAPVMLGEVIEALAPKPDEMMIDATFGAGGYTRRLLAEGCKVLAFDRDPAASAHAQALAAETGAAERLQLVSRRFSEMEAAIDEIRPLPVGSADLSGGSAASLWDGIVFDLGVSSMQLDEAERGFSFMRDGPLDMRMEGRGPSAADIVNGWEEAELARILWLYGEERASRRIAAAIVRRRAAEPFLTTLDLAAVVERTLGGRRGAPTHPATRTFQALRITVNDELGELSRGLEAAERLLGEGGRLAVVTFHSLEDRIVKSFLNARAGRTPSPSRHMPPGAPPERASFALIFNGARSASEAEAARNPRARSAKLRAAIRTSAPPLRRAA